jgi:hypothetical protein
MISSQLASILHDHGRRETQFEAIVGDNECMLITRDKKFSVTVASVPDSETVMLYGEVGRLANGEDSSGPEWILVETGDTDDGDSDRANPLGREPTLAFDERSRILAITDSAPAALLDAVAFDRWTTQFLDELVLTAKVLEEVVAAEENESQAPPFFADTLVPLLNPVPEPKNIGALS